MIRNIRIFAFAFLLLPGAATSAAGPDDRVTCFFNPLRDAVLPSGATVVTDPHPLVPAIGNAIQEEAVTQLLAAVPDEYRASYQFLVDEIRAGYVTFPEFRKALEETAVDFVTANRELIAKNEFVIYSFSNKAVKKSNRWTAELLMERKKELGLPDQVLLFESPTGTKLLDYLQESGRRDVVLVDDASYSGKQLDDILKEIDREGLRVHVVIPFLSGKAESQAIGRARQLGIDLRIYRHRKLSIFQDRIQLAVKEKRLSSGAAYLLRDLLRLDNERGLNFFDHKIPDEVSTITFQNGDNTSVLEQMRVPTSAEGTSFKKMPSIVRKIEPPYRVPPAK